jgi:hypothetical protein
MPQSEYTMNIFYIIGVVVVVLFIAGFFGLHAWTRYLADPCDHKFIANFEPKHGERERCTDRIGEDDHPIVSASKMVLDRLGTVFEDGCCRIAAGANGPRRVSFPEIAPKSRLLIFKIEQYWRANHRFRDQFGSAPLIMIGSPSSGPVTSQSAQSRDWDARATEVLAEARLMPLGQRRSDALGEAGRLRIAAEMKRWLSTK